MKKLIYSICALGAISLSLFSCDKEKESGYQLGTGVGDILPKENMQMRILMDNADTVLITNGDKFIFDEGTRVSFSGEIISERKIRGVSYYELRVVEGRMEKVLTKAPLLTSELLDNKVLADSVGNDPIQLATASIQSKYLNVNYTIDHGGAGVKHFINLVVDNLVDGVATEPVIDENGELVLNAELRQNAFNDNNYYSSMGFVSFKMEKYLQLENLKKIKMNIRYKESNNKVSIKTIVWEKLEAVAPVSFVKNSSIDVRYFSASE